MVQILEFYKKVRQRKFLSLKTGVLKSGNLLAARKLATNTKFQLNISKNCTSETKKTQGMALYQ